MKSGVYRTVCGFCHGSCGLKIRVGSQGIEDVMGDPEHPANRGYTCAKAQAAKELVESPDRLTKPLRKTARGLKPISWDDALDFAAEKLSHIRNKYGPFSLVRSNGAPVNYDARDGFLHFMQVYGSPNLSGINNCCHVPRVTAYNTVMGGKPEPDFERARLIIFWGSNPVATERYGAFCAYEGFDRIISRAKARGARVVAIDPVRSETAARAGGWVSLKPGTDAALGLAMIHVIIKENLYDSEFVAAYTVGFEELKAHVEEFTPAWATDITGISEDQITDLARALATTRPATICDGNGLDMYCNVVDAVRTVAILLALTGNVDVPGGVAFLPFAKQCVLTNVPPQSRIWFNKFPLFRDVPFPAIKESILRNEDYRPRALIAHHSNAVLAHANHARTRKALQKLEFLMVDDIFMTATAEIADLVLPATSTMERWGYKAYSSFNRGLIALSRPVADPPGEARDVFYMEYEIARRMGLGGEYPFKDSRTWTEYMLKPSGVTLAQLEREQIVCATPEPVYQKYKQSGFLTPSRKLEFYSQQLKDTGHPALPVYTEPAGVALRPALRHERAFPLLCTNRRPGQFVHTKFRNIKTLTKAYPEPLLWLSSTDAAERGINEGDLVELSSPQGSINVRAKFKPDLQPGLAMMDFGWGNPTDGLASANLLTNDAVWNPVSGSHPQRIFSCEVVKMA